MEWYKIVFIFSSLILGIQLLMSFFSTDSDFDVALNVMKSLEIPGINKNTPEISEFKEVK